MNSEDYFCALQYGIAQLHYNTVVMFAVVRSKWKSNPFTLGSYCFIPVGAKADDIETLAEPVVSKTSNKVGRSLHT